MTIDMPPVPPVVMEFAKDTLGKTGVIDFETDLNDYQVFSITYPDSLDEDAGPPPLFILYKDSEVRWATPEEELDILPDAY